MSADSCYNPTVLSVAAAQDIIRRFVQLPRAAEPVELRAALGRVLAEALLVPEDMPAQDNSGMDGYALRADDLAADGSARLRVVGTSLAGHEFGSEVAAGSCVRITTGAVIPPGCDTIVPIEFCHDDNVGIYIPPGSLKRGANCRRRGGNLRAGQVALQAGKLLRPADIGLIASLGKPELMVWRKLRVAILSSGDELRSIGQPLDAGCTHDSNRHTLWAMLTRLGCEVLDLGLVRDEPAALKAALQDACANADAVITSGGVSVGEADYLPKVAAALGDVACWRVAIRPGRPMAFGRITSGARDAVLFGLPGNPVAVMVTFYLFVRAALLRMMGAQVQPLPLLRAVSLGALRKKRGRTEYQRGILERTPDHGVAVRITGDQGSSILHSMSQADGFIVLPPEQDDVPAGTLVDFLPFEGLV